jgi:TRAP-type C4-dicarboxylate transport system permease small subunit
MTMNRNWHDAVARPFIERLERLTGFAIMIFLVAMMISLFWQVFSRFVINVPATWTEEAARYCFIYMAFFGAALGVRRSTHFGVAIFSGKLRGKARERYHRFVINVPILIASIALLIFGTRYALRFGFSRISPTFHFPMAWVFLVIPLAAIPMTLFAAYNVFFQRYTDDGESAIGRWAEEEG